MDGNLAQHALNLLVAALLGAAIGVERQWRQRLAGLRTNTLVSVGAAGFVTFASLVPGDLSPTRVAAQVVSGIGFLGAGVIFKEGANVKGLNTAATLWCAAGVGMLAGVGALAHAALLAALVVAVHLLLRPVVKAIKRRLAPEAARRDEATHLTLRVTCRAAEAPRLRAALLHALAAEPALHLDRLESITEGDRAEVTAGLATEGPAAAALERVLGRLSLDPAVSAASWREDAVDTASE